MKIKILRERELLTAIRKEFSKSSKKLSVGIGDDAAVIKIQDTHLIVTKDMLVEDTHFMAALHPPFFLGRKSLNVNLSDVAAMGGKSKYAFLGIALPSRTRPGWVEEYFSGFKSAAEESGVILAGGDVSRSKKITISVTVIGEGKTIIRRNGGKPGHLLFVSGTLGDSRQGLLLLKKGYKLEDDRTADPLLRAFLDPVPQVSIAQSLTRARLPSSMIDVSDGLAMDLLNLCQECGCGAEIDQASLPLSFELCYWQRRPYDFALHGGEDYQLLFSIPAAKIRGLTSLQEKYKITCIGRLVERKGLYLIDRQGKERDLQVKGFEHFR